MLNEKCKIFNKKDILTRIEGFKNWQERTFESCKSCKSFNPVILFNL